MNNCPKCNANLVGGSIWATFFEQSNDEAHADRLAERYGATRTTGNWGRQISIYCEMKDRTVAWECPDCEYRWSRV